MNVHPFKVFVFVIFLFTVLIINSTKSIAQTISPAGDDSASDEQANEKQAQEALKQIHDLEQKMEENGKRLDALENAVNQTDANIASHDVSAGNSMPQENYEPKPPRQEINSNSITKSEHEAAKVIANAQVALDEAAQEKSSFKLKPEPRYVIPQNSFDDSPSAIFPKEHNFEISQEEFYSAFKESGDYEIYKKNGAFYGVNMAYTYRPWRAVNWPVNVFHLESHADFGELNYNYEGDRIKDVNNYIVEPRAWLGHEFNFGPDVSLMPYAGVGYRWYFDQLKSKTDDVGDGGFNIQTQYVYVPIGAQLSFRPMPLWRIDLNSEYDFLAWGRVTNYLSNYSPIFSNLSNTLRGGYGLRESVKFVKEGENLNFFVEPYIRYWHINTSKSADILAFGIPISPYQEDANHTTEIGARVGVEF